MASTKKNTNILVKPKKDEKGYTKAQLLAHLTEAVNAQDVGEITKKQTVAFLDETVKALVAFAPATTGAVLPGLGKLVVKKTPKRPARDGVNPATGEKIRIAAKPAGKKLVFRVSKAGKVAAGLEK